MSMAAAVALAVIASAGVGIACAGQGHAGLQLHGLLWLMSLSAISGGDAQPHGRIQWHLHDQSKDLQELAQLPHQQPTGTRLCFTLSPAGLEIRRGPDSAGRSNQHAH